VQVDAKEASDLALTGGKHEASWVETLLSLPITHPCSFRRLPAWMVETRRKQVYIFEIV
jgi:hypothetical protein